VCEPAELRRNGRARRRASWRAGACTTGCRRRGRRAPRRCRTCGSCSWTALSSRTPARAPRARPSVVVPCMRQACLLRSDALPGVRWWSERGRPVCRQGVPAGGGRGGGEGRDTGRARRQDFAGGLRRPAAWARSHATPFGPFHRHTALALQVLRSFTCGAFSPAVQLLCVQPSFMGE